MTTLAQKWLPSFLTRQPSLSNVPFSTAIERARAGSPLARSSSV